MAKAQAVVVRPCSSKSPSLHIASLAMASKRRGASCCSLAKAHAVLASPCGPKECARPSISLASVSSRAGAACLAVVRVRVG